LQVPYSIAISGSDLFVGDVFAQNIGEYTTSGATVDASLVSGLFPYGIAIYGGDLYTADGGFDGSVSEYTTSGAVVDATLISGLNNPLTLAVASVPNGVPDKGSTLGLICISLGGLVLMQCSARRAFVLRSTI
jgi:hypothetical protein